MKVPLKFLEASVLRSLIVSRGKHRRLCFGVSIEKIVIPLELATCAVAAGRALGREVDADYEWGLECSCRRQGSTGLS